MRNYRLLETLMRLIPLILLSLGVLLRWFFSVELASQGSLTVARAADMLACTFRACQEGGGEVGFLKAFESARALIGLRSLVVNSPLVISYALFGVGEFSSSLYGLILSLIGGFFTWRIARRLGNESVGLLALFFWAVTPSEIVLAKSLSTALPGLTLMLCLVLVLIKRQGRLTNILIGIIVIAGFLVAPAFGLLFGFLVLNFTLLDRFSHVKFWAGVLFASGVILVGAWKATPQLVVLYWDFLRQSSSLIWLPLFFLAFGGTLDRSKVDLPTHQILIWLWTCALVTTVPTICAAYSIPYIDNYGISEISNQTFLLYPPIVVLIALYLSRGLDNRKYRFDLLIPVIGLGAVALGILSGSHLLIQDVSDLSNLTPELLLILANVCTALLLIAVLISPLVLLRKDGEGKRIFILILLTLFGLASLQVIWKDRQSQNTGVQEAKLLWSTLQAQKLELPLYVPTDSDIELLEYVSGFQRVNSDSDSVIRVIPVTGLRNGYVLIRNNTLEEGVPDNWWEMDRITGSNGTAMSLYRVLRRDEALQEIDTVKASAGISPDAYNLSELYGAYINGGRYCDAYEAWIGAQEVGGQADLIEVNSDALCFAKWEKTYSVGPDASATFSFFPGVDARAIGDAVADAPSSAWVLSNASPYYPDWRIYDIPLKLKKDAIYFLEVELQSASPTIALYLTNGKQEWLTTQNTYPKVTSVQAIFSTYGLSSNEVGFVFSPVMLGPYQTASIKKLGVAELTPP